MKILVLAGTGIGGTEKAATIFASELAKKNYTVIFPAADGPRTKLLYESGVTVVDNAQSIEELSNLIKEFKPDIIHQHVPGYPVKNNLYGALNFLDERPKVVQTHHFGYINDLESFKYVDYHTFVSMTTASQALERAKISSTDVLLEKVNVVMNPVQSPKKLEDHARAAFRRKLGLDDDTVLGVRVGRPSKVRWTSWEITAVKHAIHMGAKVKLLLVGPDEDFGKIFHKELSSGLINIFPVINDFTYLDEIYSSCDFCIYSSYYGETFGYAIAEAMAAGIPAISRSTPWGGNAQVELIENARSGWICATNREMGRRIYDFYCDRISMRKMGQAARARINEIANADQEAQLLEEIFQMLTKSEDPSLSIRTRYKDFELYKKKRIDIETTFSESNLPFTEKLEWYLYRFYRFTRTLIGKLKSYLNRPS